MNPVSKNSFFFTLILCFLMSNHLYSSFFVQDELTRVFDTHIGANIQSTISVHNTSDNIVNLRIYQSDYITDEYGNDVYLVPGSTDRSNATWVRFQSNIAIPPGQTVQFPFSINVPNNAELSGSYWSDLLIEEIINRTEHDPESIVINIRYAVGLIVNIIDTGQIDMVFENIKYYSDNISLNIKNTGNQWVSASIKIDIYDDMANFVGSFVSEKNRVYPETTKRVNVPVNLHYQTNYHALFIADCGYGSVFGHQVSFSIE